MGMRFACMALLASPLFPGAASGQSTPFGQGCPGASGLVPTVSLDVPPFSGATVDVEMDTGLPGVTCILAAGSSSTDWMGMPLPLDLAPSGLPGCQQLVSLESLFTRVTGPTSKTKACR